MKGLPKLKSSALLKKEAVQSKCQDLRKMLVQTQFGGELGAKTFAFINSIAERGEQGQPLSEKQRVWISLMLERALLGPSSFPTVKHEGKLVPSCQGCGGPADDQENHKGICTKCYKRFVRHG